MFRWLVKSVVTIALISGLASAPASTPLPPCRVYTYQAGAFRPVEPAPSPCLSDAALAPPAALPREHLRIPPDWRITTSALADVTGDGLPEWVLIVWRPWRDWPIQDWSPAPSAIAEFHDAAGDSCHLILLDPYDGRQVWAGSALPAPLLALAVDDVDGDAHNELVAIEGDYISPAGSVVVWKWNGFGFSLEWRSPPGRLRQLWLTNADRDSILVFAR